MSISQNFPEEGPTLNLNFAGSKTLDPRITFSRTTTGTYMDDSGLIKVAPADAPRFDHRYVNGEIESLGLLVEEERTNLVTDSNGGDYGYDMSSGGSPTNDIAPDGSTVACKYDLSSNTGSPFLNCNVDTTLTNGVTYTMSMWVKGTTEFTVALAFVGETNYTVTSRNMDVTTSWTRETYTFTLSGNQINSRLQVFFGTQGQGKIISIWGAQLEEGAFATSYIPRSAGSQSTREPDSVSMTGDNFSDWYNQSEGSILWRGTIHSIPISGSRIFEVYNSSTPAERIAISVENNELMYMRVRKTNDTATQTYNLGTVSLGSEYKIGLGVDGSSLCLAVNDEIKTTISDSFTLSSSDTLIFTDLKDLGGARKFTTRHTGLSYYPTRLTNAQLQTLTK